MSDLAVATSYSKRSGLLYLYEKQLADAGIPLYPIDPSGYSSLSDTLHGITKILETCKESHLIISDAWDVTFFGSREEVIRKIDSHGLLIAAERNCYPDNYLAPYFKGDTPWMCVNGGLWAGTREAIADYIDSIRNHPCYIPQMINQQWLNHRLLDGTLKVPIDSRTELFYCMFQEGGEMQPQNGRPFNVITGEYPNFVHFNGKSDPSVFFLAMRVSMSCK